MEKNSRQPFSVHEHRHRGGYILLLSVLVSSIILAISFAVYAISIKEVILASYLKDSAKAFATADRAIECALYWDRSAPQNGMPYTVFATSTAYIIPWVADPVTYPDTNVVCDGQQIVTLPAANWTVSDVEAAAAKTTFSITYPDGTCADVEVLKDDSIGSMYISQGYSTCNTADPRRTNRTIQVTSNI